MNLNNNYRVNLKTQIIMVNLNVQYQLIKKKKHNTGKIQLRTSYNI